MKKASSTKVVGLEASSSIRRSMTQSAQRGNGSMQSTLKMKSALRSSGYRTSQRSGNRNGSVYSPEYIEKRVSIISALTSDNGDHHDDEFDDDDQKKKRFKLGDPVNSGKPLGRMRDGIGMFVNSRIMQAFFTTCLIFNAILLGVMTIDDLMNDPDTAQALNIVDAVFLGIFTFELAMQVFYLGFRLLRESWLIFDFFIITFSWAFIGSSINVLRSFRIFRLFNLISKWKSLQTLFNALGRTLPKIASIGVVLLVLYYVFDVLFVSLYQDLYDEGYLDWDYFGNLEYGFISQFQMMTTDSWHEIVRQVFVARYTSYIFFYIWVILCTFVVLNLFIAAMMEALGEAREEEKMAEIEEKSKVFAANAPIEELVYKQHDLLQTQQDLHHSLSLIMKRVPELQS